MMLSYAKHPELRLMDEVLCQKVLGSDYRKRLFGMFYHNSESDGTVFRNRGVVKNGDVPELGGRDGLMKRFVDMEKKFISSGYYAENIENIYYLPKSFTQAYTVTGQKLDELFTPEVMKDIHEDCCLVFHNGITMLSVWCEEIKKYHFLMFNQGFLMIWHVYELDPEYGLTEDNSVCCWPGSEEHDMASGWVYNFYGVLLFKKYGQMEVELVARNKTLSRSQILKEKVNNFLGIDVKVLDSRWFTTICRDEGFLVSGHFRLQNYINANGQWDKKLIYINPYAKKGYHRLAPVVNVKK